VANLDLTHPLRAVWTEGRQLTGPAADLRAISGAGSRTGP